MTDLDDEILHSEGDWCFIRLGSWNKTWESWLVHTCQMALDNYLPEGAYMALGGYKCGVCGVRAPDSLIALWTLHNFDRIAENA